MEQKNNDLASFISDGNHDNIDVERENDKHSVTASDYENKPSVSRLPFYGDAMNEAMLTNWLMMLCRLFLS